MTVPSFDFGIARPNAKTWERFRVPSWSITIKKQSKAATSKRSQVLRKDALSHPIKSLRSEADYGKHATTFSSKRPSLQLPCMYFRSSTRDHFHCLMLSVPLQYREELSQRTENEKNIIDKFEKSTQLVADRRTKEQAWSAEKQRQRLWDQRYQAQLLQLVNRPPEKLSG